MIDKAVNAALKNPVQLALGAAVVLGVVYFLGRKTVTDVASAGAGLVTGNNAITRGTSYEGAGVLGTIGGATNRAVPILDDFGGWLGRTVYDWTHTDYDPNAPAGSAAAEERSWWANLKERIW